MGRSAPRARHRAERTAAASSEGDGPAVDRTVGASREWHSRPVGSLDANRFLRSDTRPQRRAKAVVGFGHCLFAGIASATDARLRDDPESESFGYQGAVYLGKAFNPFEVGADPNAKDFKVPNLSLPGGLTARSVDARRALLKTFDTLRRGIDESGVMEGLDTFKSQTLEIVAGDRMRAAFDLSAEDTKLRDQYGRHRYG